MTKASNQPLFVKFAEIVVKVKAEKKHGYHVLTVCFGLFVAEMLLRAQMIDDLA